MAEASKPPCIKHSDKGCLTGLPVIPVRPVPEIIPSLEVFLADQVAGALPALGCEGHGAPGRAVIASQARDKFQIHRG